MSKRFRIALAVFVSIMAGIVAWQVFRSSEPVYQGERLSVWLRGLDFGERTPKAVAARHAIKAMGTNCLPTLIHFLRYHDPLLKSRFAWFRTIVLRRSGIDFEQDWHRRALLAFHVLGPIAEPAVPALVEASNDPRIAGDVTQIFATMLPVSAPILTNLLANGKPIVRINAAVALAGCFSNSNLEITAITALTKALADPDPQVRQAAAHSLGKSSTHASFVVPSLLRALEETNAFVQMAAVRSLGNLGTDAKSAMPGLLKIWHANADSSYSTSTQLPWDLRSLATAAMKRIDPATAIRSLLACANDPSPQVRANVILDLGNLAISDEHSSAVIAALLKASGDPDDAVRKAAFFGLARFAPLAKEIYPTLNRELETKSPELGSIISGLITALSGFHGDTKEAVPFLIEGLSDSTEYIRTASAKALRRIDPEAASKAGVK